MSTRSRRIDELATAAFLLLGLAFLGSACGDEKPSGAPPAPAAVEPRTAPTQLRVHTLSIQNVAFDGQKGAGFVSLHDGRVYDGQDAVAHAERIDFRHQYRGADIRNRRSFENLTTKGRWDSRGLFAGIDPTESRVMSTSLATADFDGIESRDDLLQSFDFHKLLERGASSYRRVYLSDGDGTPLAVVFAFLDNGGKRGLFKIRNAEEGPVDSTPVGTLTIEVKVEE